MVPLADFPRVDRSSNCPRVSCPTDFQRCMTVSSAYIMVYTLLVFHKIVGKQVVISPGTLSWSAPNDTNTCLDFLLTNMQCTVYDIEVV